MALSGDAAALIRRRSPRRLRMNTFFLIAQSVLCHCVSLTHTQIRLRIYRLHVWIDIFIKYALDSWDVHTTERWFNHLVWFLVHNENTNVVQLVSLQQKAVFMVINNIGWKQVNRPVYLYDKRSILYRPEFTPNKRSHKQTVRHQLQAFNEIRGLLSIHES